MGNADAALQSIASEINELHAQDKADHQGKMAAMGRKLLAVREILRERNGEDYRRIEGPDGKRPPLGWGAWIKENLTIKTCQANNCIRYAVGKDTSVNRQRRHAIDGSRAFTYLRKWQNFTDHNKRRITEFVFSRWQEERT